MQALVLAAGLGTRLRPLTDVRAKPAIPVAGTPIIRRIVAWLSAQGIVDVAVNLHARPETLTAVLGDGSDLGARIRYSWEHPQALGSAGGPRHALSMLGSRFLIVNGDTLTDVDLEGLSRQHAEWNALVTLALVPNREPRRYGGVLLDGEQRVRGFVPPGTTAEDSYHFVGVHLVESQVFQALADGVPTSSIGDVYDKILASRPDSIRGFVSDASFADIGTPADYFRTSMTYARKERDTMGATWPGDGTVVGKGLTVQSGAAVKDSILWDAVTLGGGCTIDRCIVTDGVSVPAGATFRDAMLVAAEDGTPMTFALELAE